MTSISLTTWLHLVAANVLIFPATIAAHSGGLDAYGCHHDRKAGGYHCHRGSLAGQSFASKAEMKKALKATQQSGESAQTEEKGKDTPR